MVSTHFRVSRKRANRSLAGNLQLVWVCVLGIEPRFDHPHARQTPSPCIFSLLLLNMIEFVFVWGFLGGPLLAVLRLLLVCSGHPHGMPGFDVRQPSARQTLPTLLCLWPLNMIFPPPLVFGLHSGTRDTQESLLALFRGPYGMVGIAPK